MNNAEKLILCSLIFVIGVGAEATFGRHNAVPTPVVSPPAEDELTTLIHERCGHDERPCEDRTRRCVRACDGIGGRMVEMAPTDIAGIRIYDVCVCASPGGIDRYFEDFSRHERVTQLYCEDSE